MTATGPRLLVDQVRDALIAAGTWVTRRDLAGLTTSTVALDDVLADLVIDGRAEFRQAVGYRIAGTELTRKALQQLVRRPHLNRFVIARQVERRFSLGIAERRAEIGLVSYEMELPEAEDDAGAIAQAQAMANFWNTNMELKDGRQGN